MIHIVLFETKMRRGFDIRARIEGGVDIGKHVTVLFTIVRLPGKRAQSVL